MNKQAHSDLSGYYDEAQSWASDRERRQRFSSRLAWIIAGMASCIAIAEAVAIAALVPLKTTVPYTILVDRQTGHVEALDPLKPGTISPDMALTRSLLAQYVIARESFAIESLQYEYRKVALWSSGEARQAYLGEMQSSNPSSPLAVLPRGALIQVEIRGISSLGPNTALVRFDKIRTDPGGRRQAAEPWTAVVTYRFSRAEMHMGDRLINPLGFQVVRYRRDAEMPQPLPEAQSNISGSNPSAAGSLR
jgi:type IV secretion system protein VirB8